MKNNEQVHENDLLRDSVDRRPRRDILGVTVVEYAIMLAIIAIAVAAAAPNITSAILGVFERASSVMVKTP